MRTKDYYPDVNHAEIEDLLRDSLVAVVKSEYGKDLSTTVTSQKNRPIIDILSTEITDFSKYKLAKAYIRWTRNNEAKDLSEKERTQWTTLFQNINKVLK